MVGLVPSWVAQKRGQRCISAAKFSELSLSLFLEVIYSVLPRSRCIASLVTSLWCLTRDLTVPYIDLWLWALKITSVSRVSWVTTTQIDWGTEVAIVVFRVLLKWKVTIECFFRITLVTNCVVFADLMMLGRCHYLWVGYLYHAWSINRNYCCLFSLSNGVLFIFHNVCNVVYYPLCHIVMSINSFLIINLLLSLL